MNFRNLKYTMAMRLFGWLKIPLVGFTGPKMVQFDESHCTISIPLGYKTKNHVGSMYFGALAVGAELSIAAAAVFAIQESGKRVDFLFKDFKCDFLKRGDGNVHFHSAEVREVKALIEKAILSKEREEQKFYGYANVPGRSDEAILKYELTMSVKSREK